MSQQKTVFNTLKELPEGYTIGIYEGQKYGVTKTVFNEGSH